MSTDLTLKTVLAHTVNTGFSSTYIYTVHNHTTNVT